MTTSTAGRARPDNVAANSAAEVDRGVLPDLIGFNLRLSYGIASQVFSRVFEAVDLAPIQFAALELISHRPLLSQTEIAKHIGTSPPVLVRPFERLEQRGLISRKRAADDRRRFLVEITEAGERLMKGARAHIAEVEDELTAPLSASERDTLLVLLQRLSDRG